jgi:hypothetical protein
MRRHTPQVPAGDLEVKRAEHVHLLHPAPPRILPPRPAPPRPAPKTMGLSLPRPSRTRDPQPESPEEGTQERRHRQSAVSHVLWEWAAAACHGRVRPRLAGGVRSHLGTPRCGDARRASVSASRPPPAATRARCARRPQPRVRCRACRLGRRRRAGTASMRTMRARACETSLVWQRRRLSPAPTRHAGAPCASGTRAAPAPAYLHWTRPGGSDAQQPENAAREMRRDSAAQARLSGAGGDVLVHLLRLVDRLLKLLLVLFLRLRHCCLLLFRLHLVLVLGPVRCTDNAGRCEPHQWGRVTKTMQIKLPGLQNGNSRSKRR